MIRNHHASASSAKTETAPAPALPEGASAPIPLEWTPPTKAAQPEPPEGPPAEVETWRPVGDNPDVMTAYAKPYRLVAQADGQWAACWSGSFGREYSVSGALGPSASSFPSPQAFARWQAINAALDASSGDWGDSAVPAGSQVEWDGLRWLLAAEEDANRYAWHPWGTQGIAVIEFDDLRIEVNPSGAWVVLVDGDVYDGAQCVPSEHATPEDSARHAAILAALEAIEKGRAKTREGAADGLRRVLLEQETERKRRPLSWLKTEHGEGFVFNDVRVLAFDSGLWEVSFVGDVEGAQVEQKPRGASGAVLVDALGALSFPSVKAAALRACIKACEADGETYSDTLPRLREMLAELRQFAPRSDVEKALEERKQLSARVLGLAERETGVIGLAALAQAFAELRDDPKTREAYATNRAALGPGGTLKAAADSISDAIAPLADVDPIAFAARELGAINAAVDGFTRLAALAMVARAAVLLDPTPARPVEPAAAPVEPEKGAEG